MKNKSIDKKTVCQIIWNVVLILYIAVICYLCMADMSGAASKFPSKILGFESDKVVHFLMFLPFTTIAYFALGKSDGKTWKAILLAIGTAFIGVLLAGTTEFLQTFTAYRTSSEEDFYVDCVAVFVSAIIAVVLDFRFSKK